MRKKFGYPLIEFFHVWLIALFLLAIMLCQAVNGRFQ